MKTEAYKMKHDKMTEADVVKATTNLIQRKPTYSELVQAIRIAKRGLEDARNHEYSDARNICDYLELTIAKAEGPSHV